MFNLSKFIGQYVTKRETSIYYERGTIQRIAESLHKGGFDKHDKG